MSELSEREVRTEAGSTKGAADRSPVRVFALGAIVIIVVVAGLLAAIRTFVFPVWEANSEGVRHVATAQAQLSVAMTQEALTPAPTATRAVAAPIARTGASTPTLATGPATFNQPERRCPLA